MFGWIHILLSTINNRVQFQFDPRMCVEEITWSNIDPDRYADIHTDNVN